MPFPKTGMILGARIALHFGKTPLSTPLRVKGRLVYEKM